MPLSRRPGLIIRDAVAADAGALLAIYAPFVRDTAVSFELEPPTVEDFAERIARAQTRWAWLVAERDGDVAGYAYGSAFRDRAAYRFSVEVSVYVAPHSRGTGIGRSLYETLFTILVAKGFCTAFAGITVPNEPSVSFHRALGFTEVGVFRRAGWKFGSWHDVSWWQRSLRDGPPPD